jgi:hypothetical protein
MLGLKTLSQRTLVAMSKMVGLATIASVFWLFMSIPNPSTYQLIWGGMYAVFILLFNVLVFYRRDKPQ